MNESISKRFSDHIFDVVSSNITPESFEQIKFCLLDYLGATHAGVRMNSNKLSVLLELYDEIPNGVTPIGFNTKVALRDAAYINGLSSHAAEMDDGYRFGMSHPGAPVFSALMALVQTEKGNTQLFYKAVIAGYEVITRLSAAVQPTHYSKGYHPTATTGAIGVAAAVSVYIGTSREQLHRAVVAAATCCGGTLKAIEGKSEIKPQNIANAVSVGINAAYLAKAGFESPDDGFGGDTGFLAVMSSKPHLDELIKGGSDEKPRIMDVYFKPYAACRHAHAAIEAAIKLRALEDFELSKIESITVHIYETVIGKHDHNEVVGVNSAKMSIPFSIALALMHGKAGIREFQSKIVNDVQLVDLALKVEVIGDPELSKLVPLVRPAILKVKQENGCTFEERVDLPKGEPENPMSRADAEEKFSELCIYAGIDAESIDRFLANYWEKDLLLETRLDQAL